MRMPTMLRPFAGGFIMALKHDLFHGYLTRLKLAQNS